jgi:hypothetical protein
VDRTGAGGRREGAVNRWYGRRRLTVHFCEQEVRVVGAEGPTVTKTMVTGPMSWTVPDHYPRAEIKQFLMAR